MSNGRILVAGIGNIFLGDDAFGVEVAQLLAKRPLPERVRVIDFGIRGFDLACALLEGYDAAILVDAAPRGGAPGNIYTIEIEPADADPYDQTLEMHNLNPVKVLQLVKTLGGEPQKLLLVGCEPADSDSDEERMGLSEPVQLAVQEAAGLVESLARELAETIQIRSTSHELG